MLYMALTKKYILPRFIKKLYTNKESQKHKKGVEQGISYGTKT